MYNIVYKLHSAKVIKSKWVDNIKELLCSLGFSGIWYNQCCLNIKWLVNASKQKLKGQFIQKWITNLEMTSDSNNYKLFKTKFEKSEYVLKLPSYLCVKYIRFRTRNHRLPVEVGRWRSIPLSDRKCNLCNKDIGDEYHYLLNSLRMQDRHLLSHIFSTDQTY